jgi:cytochrome P450
LIKAIAATDIEGALRRACHDVIGNGYRGELFLLFRTIALNLVLEICFGQGVLPEHFIASCERVLKMTTAWEVFSHRGQIETQELALAVRNLKQDINEIVADVAGGRRRCGGFLGLWLSDERLGRDRLTDELCTVLSAGTDPNAAALTWSVYFIATEPEVAERLRTESGASACDAGNVSYLDGVWKETLRMMPVVPLVDRVVDQPTIIAGEKLEAGDRVAACSFLTHHRSDIYPDAARFDPRRFLVHDYSPFEYYPFGGGVHRCIGAVLAARIIRAGIVTFQTSYTTELARVPPGVTMRGVVLAPRTGLRARVARVQHA